MFNRNKPKPIHKSKAAQGSAIALIGVGTVIIMNVFAIADRNIEDEKRRADLDNIETILLEILKNVPAIVSAGGTIYALWGRIKADAPIYTPNGLPGPNKEDLENNE